MKQPKVYILGAKRTPLANFQGELKSLTATDLGARAIAGALDHANLTPDEIDGVLMGCVLPAGVGQAPARQAAIKAGLPPSCGCTTINKVCGSAMQSTILAYDSIRAGSANVMIAGGMESMTNAPYLLPKARQGYRLGHQQVLDHMFVDGLEDAYDSGKLMGQFAENCATKYAFSREAQDAFTAQSLTRAQAADFNAEITPMGEITTDEGPRTLTADKIASLRPVFASDGTITAANASSISDGAAALVLAAGDTSTTKPIAQIIGHANHAQTPEWFTTAPIGAIQSLLTKTGWSVQDVDLFEINEAFAVVTLAAIKELALDADKVNVNGGACVLGHPLGATGARIIVTLINALRQRKLKRGVAALCIGGGEATAIAIELCE